jgi:hypothetical protein
MATSNASSYGSFMTIMKNASQESTRKFRKLATLLVLAHCMVGCTYQLTNLKSSTPNNIRSIYVEAIYDTASEPVPHEVLWDEIQRAIAANGQLRLARPYEADAILRAHIVRAQTGKAGERKAPVAVRRTSEPDVFAGQQQPQTPGQLRDISIADDYFMKTSWSSAVHVEVWDLTTRKLVLQRQYALSGEVPTIRGDVPAEIHHIRNEESFQHSFGNASKAVAERIVGDLLVR